MTLMQITFLASIFGAASIIAYVVVRLVIPKPTQSRLEKIASDGSEFNRTRDHQWESKLNKVIGPFAKLSLPSEGWEKSMFRTRFMNAGYRYKSTPYYYFGIKTLLPVVFLGVFFFFIGVSRLELSTNGLVLLLLIFVSAGYYLPNIILSHIVKVRQRDLFENFPDAIDLMTVCVEAGLGLDAAMKKVGEEMYLKCKPLSEEFHLVNLEIRAGRSRSESLQNLALRTGVEEIEGFVSMLVQADRFGTSVAAALRVHSDMLRTKRRLRAEEAAAKIATKLLFPLIFLIFPGLMIVLLGPAMIQVYRNILPVLAGQ